MIDVENGSNYEQVMSISIPVAHEYVDLIDDQSKTIDPYLDVTNYFDKFLLEVCNVSDISQIEDNSIYIDTDIDDITRSCIDFFQDEIDSVFESNLGIRFQETNLFLLRAIYNIFVCNLSKYFIYFIHGLQNTDMSFSADMPDYETYKYKYFIEKYGKKESEYENISAYIQYVLTLNLSFSDYISVALLESEGDVDLSAVFVEDANYRIDVDNLFLFNKLRNIILSPDINDYVVSNIMGKII